MTNSSKMPTTFGSETNKNVVVGGVVLVALVVASASVVYRVWAAPPAEQEWANSQPIEDAPAKPYQTPTDQIVELTGKVLNADGSFAKGAKVAIISQKATTFSQTSPIVTVGDNGTFKLPVSRSELALYLGTGQGVALVATCDGCGIAWGSAGSFLPAKELGVAWTKEPVLRLVKDDAPLVGEIITRGKPVAAGHVEVLAIWANDRNEMKPWMDAVSNGKSFGEATWGLLSRYLVGPGLEQIHATADASGRFRLSGLGRGRLVALRVWGARAACACILVRTEPGDKVAVNGLSNALYPAANGCFGNTMVIELAPSRPIEGVVTDVDTGKPIAGARLQSQKFAGTNMIFSVDSPLSTRSDDAGKFRLEGFPIGEDNLILVRPGLQQPYVPTAVEVDSTKRMDCVHVDVKLRKGTWVEGRVTDAKTGRPLVSAIDLYYPLNNPNLDRYPGFSWIAPGQLFQTDGAGKFRIPVIPGRVAVAAKLVGTGPERGERATSQAGRVYLPIKNDLQLDGFPHEPTRGFYNVAPTMLAVGTYHQIQSLNVPVDGATITCNLQIE